MNKLRLKRAKYDVRYANDSVHGAKTFNDGRPGYEFFIIDEGSKTGQKVTFGEEQLAEMLANLEPDIVKFILGIYAPKEEVKKEVKKAPAKKVEAPKAPAKPEVKAEAKTKEGKAE